MLAKGDERNFMSYSKDVKGFCLYPNYREFLTLLSDGDRGQLLMSLFDYYDGYDTSASLTPQTQMAYAFITSRMGEDLDRTRRRSQINRENASKRWPLRTPKEGEDSEEDG